MPLLGEQSLIVERINVFDVQIKQEHVQLAKWGQMKSGPMDDLLTGRIRVTPLLEAAATP